MYSLKKASHLCRDVMFSETLQHIILNLTFCPLEDFQALSLSVALFHGTSLPPSAWPAFPPQQPSAAQHSSSCVCVCVSL